MSSRICSIAFFVALALAPTATAEDWPTLGRDRTRNAVSPEKNPPLWWQVPLDDGKTLAKNIKWQARLGHNTMADPVVANGLVWVGTTNDQPRDPKIKERAPVLMCFREKDGKFLYQHATKIPPGEPFADFNFVGHPSAPLAEPGRIWFTTVACEVVCLDVAMLERGQGMPREIWKLDMRKDFGVVPSFMPMGYGRVCSIASYRDFIYVLTGNGTNEEGRVPAPKAPSLLCIQKNTGKVIWSDNSPGKNIVDGQFASPLVIEVSGRAQAIAPMGDGWIRSFDAVTGELLWKFFGNSNKVVERTKEWKNWIAAPVFHDGRIYIGNGNGPNHPTDAGPGWLYCLDPGKKGDISAEVESGPANFKPNPNSGVIWKFGGLQEKRRRFTGCLASVAIHAGLVIANDYNGYVNCLDAKTGQLYWKHDLQDASWTSPLIVDGNVFIASEGGDMFLFALDKEKKVLDRLDMDRGVFTSPVFANGVLFLATRDTLYAIAGTEKNPRAKTDMIGLSLAAIKRATPSAPEKNPPTWWQMQELDAQNKVTQPAKNVLWSTGLGSLTYGDPVAVDGMIWVGTNNQWNDPRLKNQDASVLACLDERTGRILHRYFSPRLQAIVHDWPGSSMACSPLIEGQRMWLLTNRCEVVCLDLEPLRNGTGEPRQLWKVDLPKQLGVFPHGTPMALTRKCSIATFHELIYVITGNGTDDTNRNVPAPDAPSLVCFNKNTGKVVWTDNSPGKNILQGQWASPLVIKINGQDQVVAPQGDGWVRAFEAQTGKLIWKFDTNPKDAKWQANGRGTRNNILATPVFHDKHIFIGNGHHPEHGDGPAWLYCIDPTKTGDISPELADTPGKGKANPNSGMIWRFGGTDARTKRPKFNRTVSNVAIDRGLVIAPDIAGIVHCLDEQTGQEYWTHDTRTTIMGSPLIVDGKVYVAADDRVWILALAKEKKVLEEIEMTGRVSCSPIFAHGVLYIATANRLFAIAGDEKKPGEETGGARPRKERPRAPDAIFVPTPQDVVDKMLQIADVKKTDLVVDLGCGDGRIVVTAAKKFGCRAIGYDLDPICVRLSDYKVRQEKVEKLVTIEQKDIFTLDLSQADVVALYLLPKLNVKLLPQLDKLKAGARIVSHQFPMAGIRPERVVRYRSSEDGVEHTLYLWTAPLKRE